MGKDELEKIKKNNRVYELLLNDNDIIKDFIDQGNIIRTPWRDKEDGSERSLCFREISDISKAFKLNEDIFYKYVNCADKRIKVLHSSALMPLLLFYKVSSENSLYVNLGRKEPVEFDEVYFETPNKVFDETRPSKIDIALVSTSSKIVLYLESKFTEYLSGKSSGSFSPKYENMVREILGQNQPAKENNKYYIRGKLADKDIIYGEGIKQMIAHFIGVCKGGTESNAINDYIKNKGYSVLLGGIVYKWDKRFSMYSDLFQRVTSKMNELLNKHKERTGCGSDLKVTDIDPIVNNAPQDFSVLENLLTYQNLLILEENKTFKENIERNIKQFYKLD